MRAGGDPGAGERAEEAAAAGDRRPFGRVKVCGGAGPAGGGVGRLGAHRSEQRARRVRVMECPLGREMGVLIQEGVALVSPVAGSG